MIKKSYIFIAILGILLPLTWVHALSSSQKGAILETFKKKQYELLFESNLSDFSSEYTDIFNISKKVDIYENVGDKAEKEREKVQSKNIVLLDKITSLEKSVKQLDIDISNTLIKVDKINKEVIQVKKEVEINGKTIDILKKKISENREILLEYLIYIYKKQNTIFDDTEIDNLKSILLNEENISDVINDLYFKSIIHVAGKRLIDNHRRYISELYLKKVKLEKQEENLKKLRRLGIIEKKILSDKKAFKERIIKISKGQQSFYQKYVYDKLEIEKNLQLKAFKEKVKFNSIRKNILNKYNCEFVDVSKNTAEVRSLSGKCLDINQMIYSESKLEDKGALNKGFNFFNWPVEPNKGISRYFHDPEYSKDFGSEHEALDIIVDQGTPIRAPADGYVIFIEKPNSENYAYVALKHYNGYMTIYGHISDVLVDQFAYVKAGEVFAQSGGEFGTLGAGFLTTGPHLHFEIFKDKEYIDPFTVLDLSYIKFTKLAEKYKYKFYNDFKIRRGYEFKNKNENSRVFRLDGDNEIERQKNLISKYAVGSFNNWQMWIDESLDGNIDPSFVMCIGLAETTMGKNLASPYNIGNVGNNDRGDRKALKNARSGIYLIISTLNNKYFKYTNSIAELSGSGRKVLKLPSCKQQGIYCYATDINHWHNNIVKCLSTLKGTYVPDNYNFRLIK